MTVGITGGHASLADRPSPQSDQPGKERDLVLAQAEHRWRSHREDQAGSFPQVPFTQGLESLTQRGVRQAEGRPQLGLIEAGEQQVERRAERGGEGTKDALVVSHWTEVRSGGHWRARGRILGAERFARSAPASAARKERSMSPSGAVGTQQERIARQFFTTTKRRDDQIVRQVFSLVCDATVAARDCDERCAHVS